MHSLDDQYNIVNTISRIISTVVSLFYDIPHFVFSFIVQIIARSIDPSDKFGSRDSLD